jgi:hypothetical protein
MSRDLRGPSRCGVRRSPLQSLAKSPRAGGAFKFVVAFLRNASLDPVLRQP